MSSYFRFCTTRHNSFVSQVIGSLVLIADVVASLRNGPYCADNSSSNSNTKERETSTQTWFDATQIKNWMQRQQLITIEDQNVLCSSHNVKSNVTCTQIKFKPGQKCDCTFLQSFQHEHCKPVALTKCGTELLQDRLYKLRGYHMVKSRTTALSISPRHRCMPFLPFACLFSISNCLKVAVNSCKLQSTLEAKVNARTFQKMNGYSVFSRWLLFSNHEVKVNNTRRGFIFFSSMYILRQAWKWRQD